MESGKLRHKLTVKSPTSAPLNEYGEPEPSHELVATIWADIQPVNSRDILNAQQIGVIVTHRLTFRSCPEVTQKCRLYLGSREFTIASLINVGERNETMEALCQESVV